MAGILDMILSRPGDLREIRATFFPGKEEGMRAGEGITPEIAIIGDLSNINRDNQIAIFNVEWGESDPEENILAPHEFILN